MIKIEIERLRQKQEKYNQRREKLIGNYKGYFGRDSFFLSNCPGERVQTRNEQPISL